MIAYMVPNGDIVHGRILSYVIQRTVSKKPLSYTSGDMEGF
jgi:hypothetical protein